MFHVYTFTKGNETLTMVYTKYAIKDGRIDPMAPIGDGWKYDSNVDIPKIDESYDSIKELWTRNINRVSRLRKTRTYPDACLRAETGKKEKKDWRAI